MSGNTDEKYTLNNFAEPALCWRMFVAVQYREIYADVRQMVRRKNTPLRFVVNTKFQCTRKLCGKVNREAGRTHGLIVRPLSLDVDSTMTTTTTNAVAMNGAERPFLVRRSVANMNEIKEPLLKDIKSE